jgi:cyclopropane fatty-acyl-phospholipid synthase-like methyltransferase
MSYDRRYAEVDALFGTEPERTLAQFAARLRPDGPVLDVGAGQGRNALPLAREGRSVHALEPSGVAAAGLENVARRERLPLEVFATTVERFDPPVAHYAGILVFGLIPDLPWTGIRELVERVERWSGPGTLVWVTGFTTEDPAFAEYASACAEVGANSFETPGGRVRTYLEPGQILELLGHYAVLHHWEGPGPEHRHGDGPLERHGTFEVVCLKATA